MISVLSQNLARRRTEITDAHVSACRSCCMSQSSLFKLRHSRQKYSGPVQSNHTITNTNIRRWKLSVRTNKAAEIGMLLLCWIRWLRQQAYQQGLFRPTLILNRPYLTTELKSQWPCMSPQHHVIINQNDHLLMCWGALWWGCMGERQSECLNHTEGNISAHANHHLLQVWKQGGHLSAEALWGEDGPSRKYFRASCWANNHVKKPRWLQMDRHNELY